MEAKGGVDYGSPIQTCKKCGKLFIDKDYREIAVSGIRKTDTKKVSPFSIYIFSASLIAFIGVLVFFVMEGTFSIGILLAVTFFLSCSIYNIVTEYKEYDLRQEFLREEKRKSETRLSNYQYASFLKQIGYDVPPKYLVPPTDLTNISEQKL